jgi:four helix bundle protein
MAGRMDSTELKERTMQFGVDVVHLSDKFPPTTAGREVCRQLVRAGTAVGANYRAACRGRSHAEFIAKIGNAQEESDESVYWLELSIRSRLLTAAAIGRLAKEADELTAIFTASLITAKQHHRR